MDKEMADVVIIGAGLTGLSTAYHLEKNGFTSFALFEKEKEVGGLCRSVTQDGFTFDFTGHLLHISDTYFRSLLETIVGFSHFNNIERSSFIYSHKTFTRYPFQTNLYGLPDNVVIDCILGFINRKKSKAHKPTFPAWVAHNFGDGFARHFFLPYQSKIFAYNPHKITASWTNRFVPATSLEQIIKGSLRDSYTEPIGYNAHFFYPKEGGIFSWVKKFSDQILSPINLDCSVKSIHVKEKYITFSNGRVERYKHLITSIPLDTLLHLLIEKSSTHLASARKKLLCNTVINFNLGIKKENISNKHWIYFPESSYPFYRLGFTHNFSTSMTPPGHSSLYGEFSYIKKSDDWVARTLDTALATTKNFLNIGDSDIATEKIIHIKHAYVIYDQWREDNLARLLKQLEQESIYSVGRYGQWKYSSMQEAMLDGKQIVDTLMRKGL